MRYLTCWIHHWGTSQKFMLVCFFAYKLWKGDILASFIRTIQQHPSLQLNALPPNNMSQSFGLGNSLADPLWRLCVVLWVYVFACVFWPQFYMYSQRKRCLKIHAFSQSVIWDENDKSFQNILPRGWIMTHGTQTTRMGLYASACACTYEICSISMMMMMIMIMIMLIIIFKFIWI